MKICTIIGARPQFIKAAVVSAKFAELKKLNPEIEEIIIHTGQHYDNEMSEIFFKELCIPKEKYNLAVGSAKHGAQTGKMLEEAEIILSKEKPEGVLIYGDTNSTLAGALASAKMHIPVFHVEGGMRSYNKKMPEEINRIVADHLASLNFCSTKTAMANLKKEGLSKTAVFSGDVMYDCVLNFRDLAEKHSSNIKKFKLENSKYILVTCHRQENTDDLVNFSQIIEALNDLSQNIKIIFPVHPRTRKLIEKTNVNISNKIILSPPLSYFETLVLEKNATIILTDSGGIQKEAFFMSVPCVTMRNETEWVETVKSGWNIVAGANKNKILEAAAKFAKQAPAKATEDFFGDGNASEIIVTKILKFGSRPYLDI